MIRDFAPKRFGIVLLFTLHCLFVQYAVEATSMHAPTLEPADMKFKDACGVISTFVSLRALGLPITLEEVGRLLNWNEGEPLTLMQIVEGLSNYKQVAAYPVRLSAEELKKLLETEEYVAILAIRKRSQEIDHAVAAIGMERVPVESGASQRIILVDYPELNIAIPDKELADIWDGGSILIRRETLGPNGHIRWIIAIALGVSFVALWALILRVARKPSAT